MNQNKYVIFLLFLLLCSCHSDDNNNVSERIVVVTIEYEDGLGLHGDSYARIYVYYDIYATDIADYAYSSDGTLVNEDQLIAPDMVITSDKQGNIAALKLESARKITIIAESSYYADKRIVQSYSPGYLSIADTYIFRE